MSEFTGKMDVGGYAEVDVEVRTRRCGAIVGSVGVDCRMRSPRDQDIHSIILFSPIAYGRRR